jgi:vacuolar iron transporter family protein
MPGAESHYVNRTGWLRAAVLGANDGIISTASLIVGVASAEGTRGAILTAAIAGWAAGAMSMAAGEYVSVSSQADSEAADLKREQRALRERPAEEKEELAHIYEDRGLKPKLAEQVAGQLMAKDALDAHARDELGLSEGAKPRPILAAFTSALAFSVGAALPTLAAFLAASGAAVIVVPVAALVFLIALGALGARLGGAPMLKAALRVGLWGALAMAVTAGIGALIGKAVPEETRKSDPGGRESSYCFAAPLAPNRLTREAMNQRLPALRILNIDWT